DQLRFREIKVHMEHRLVEGNPATEILHVARETGCDLIVMGTHGRRGLKRLLMGSVAEDVMRKVPYPVMIVKAPLPKAPPSEESLPEMAGNSAEEVLS